MKTASVNPLNFSTPAQVQFLYSANITSSIMKKLTNISPFLLLLVPVFMMIALTFTTSNNNSHNEEVTAKTSGVAKGFVRVSTISYK